MKKSIWTNRGMADMLDNFSSFLNFNDCKNDVKKLNELSFLSSNSLLCRISNVSIEGPRETPLQFCIFKPMEDHSTLFINQTFNILVLVSTNEFVHFTQTNQSVRKRK
ncbi:hypothetical protein O6H91_Y149200 [Diphasiastrum complanatum]|nr:hypothetical protein O6H91_Y149200 [Diphasiastrum complanatum]